MGGFFSRLRQGGLWLGLACLVGCSDPLSGGPASIEGAWNLTTSRVGFTCFASLAIAMDQDAEAFEASYTEFGPCTALGNNFRNDQAGPITGGRVVGTSVSFSDAQCSFVGNVREARDGVATRMSGSMSCGSSGSGTWQATR